MDELAGELRDLGRRGALGGVVAQDLVRVVMRALELEQDAKRELPRLVAFACGPAATVRGRQLLKATLETKTFTSPTSRPSMRSVASTTLP